VEIGTPSVVSRADAGLPPRRRRRACLVYRECHAWRAPFSPRGMPSLRASARRAKRHGASALPTICLAAPRAPGRAMLRTDFCHLTSSYEHPRLVGSRFRSRAQSPCLVGELLVHAREARFGGPHLRLVVIAWGVVFPSPCVRTRFWHPCRGFCRGPACARAPVAVAAVAKADAHRPREAVRVGQRPEMPSVRRGPLPRDALSSARLGPSPATRLGHR